MNDHSGGLVHDEQGVVLVDDTDRYFLAGDDAFLDLWNLDPDRLTSGRSIAGLFTATVHHYVALRNKGRGLGTRQPGVVGNKEIEADIAVRLDGKLLEVAQRLALRGRVRHGSGSDNGGGRSLFPPENPCKEKSAHAYGHVSDVEGWPPQIADPDVDEVDDAAR